MSKKPNAEKFIDYLEGLLPRLIERERKDNSVSDYARGFSGGNLSTYEFIRGQIQEFRAGKHFY